MMAGNFGEPTTMKEVYSLPGRIEPSKEAGARSPGCDDPRPALRHGNVAEGRALEAADDLTLRTPLNLDKLDKLDKRLSPDHRRILFEESSITPEVAARARIFTASRGKDVPQGSGYLPSRPGMVFPTYTLAARDADGEVFHRLRLDNPGEGPKYRQPAGVSNRLYIHPDQHDLIRSPGRMRFVVEGEKKTLSGVSKGLLCIGLSGVWNGQKDKALIPDWDLLPLDGENYSVCYDSDLMDNLQVLSAAERQARLLQGKGAKVYVTLLPHAPDGTKQGLDDFFANGGTVEQLRSLTRPYKPELFAGIRLSRDGMLRDALDGIRAAWWEADWNRIKGTGEKPHWMRGYSARDVEEAMIRLAEKHGKLNRDGVKFRAGVRTISDEAGKGKPGVIKALKHLEAEGRIRIHQPKNPKEARSYTLLKGAQVVTTKRYGASTERGSETELEARLVYGNVLRAPTSPRLRWSAPARKGTLLKRREKYGDSIRVVTEVASEDRPYIHRIGPRRGAIIDVLERSECPVLLGNLCELLNFKRPRDVRRRVLPMLEEYGIISVRDDFVSLAEDWRERLEECRREKGEIRAAELQKSRHREESRQYREQGKTPKASLEAVRQMKELRERRLRERREEKERDRAAAVRPPSAVEALVSKYMKQHERIRLGLLCDLAREEGLRSRDIPPVVRNLGYRVERLPEYDNAEFVYAEKAAA